MDPQYARNIGVNIDDLLVSRSDTGEQALEITEGEMGACRPAGTTDVTGAAQARRHA
jgi:RecA/RadA recombinase